jgi:hypothetical protein
MKHLRLFLLALTCIAGLAAPTAAEVPSTLSYQGVLTDASGSAVNDGTYTIEFRIYDVASGGSALWTETRSVDVLKGVFSVILGEVSPILLGFDAQYWLGISVAGEAELTPRMKLASSAYSLNAGAVNGESNKFPSSGYVGIGIKYPGAPLHIWTEDITGLRIDGTAGGAWASIVLNAQGVNSLPSFEYYRQGSFRARTYVDPQNNWKLVLGGSTVISAMEGSNRIGLGGVTNPMEQLEVNGAIKLGYTGQMNPGTIRWTGMDFEGYDGVDWRSLTASGGSLPAGSAGQTLRHDGSAWVADTNITNRGHLVGIGTSEPYTKLHVKGVGTTYVDIEATGDYAPGVLFAQGGGIKWNILYHPIYQRLEFGHFTPADPLLQITDGGIVGVGPDPLLGTAKMEVHDPDPPEYHTAFAAYSYFNSLPTTFGARAIVGSHVDDGNGGIGVYGEGISGGANMEHEIGVYGYTDDGYGVWSEGTLGTSGATVSVVGTRDHGWRHVYAMESPSNWFEDFGSARLSGGEARVELEPVFAQTVALNEGYHVFLTPLGDCALYVSEKNERGFVVKIVGGAAGSGAGDVAFDYRIVAKRSGYETKRLEAAEDPAAMEQRLGVGRALTDRPRAAASVRDTRPVTESDRFGKR